MSQVGIDPQISLRKQCELLGVSRSTWAYHPRGESEENLHYMHLIDRLHLAHPEWGYPMMTMNLRRMGHRVNHKRVARLMKLMRIRSILPKPKTTLRHPDHKVYPYLLRDLKVSYPNHVWAADITYIPMAKGFMYLVAIIDWYSRFVISWQLSNSLETIFCILALEQAWAYGCPKIFNTDQGVQFTSTKFTQCLKDKQVDISMDGKGRALDNVFVERLWWSIKYEDIYPKAYENGQQLHQGIKRYIEYYNYKRLHSSLQYNPPASIYTGEIKLDLI
ncbi:MAG: IS3 family transposase [Bacteroidota bacterium]